MKLTQKITWGAVGASAVMFGEFFAGLSTGQPALRFLFTALVWLVVAVILILITTTKEAR